jgi:arylsulfatase A-like enzyme
MTKAKWKRWINAGCGCLAMAGATGLEAASAAGTQKRPNIVFIISDDSGWGDVGWNGNPVLDTPVLDALHKQSVELTRFYVAPVCAPTRAALLTGRHPLRVGVLNTTKGRQVLPGEELTIAEALKEAGYATGCFGKWHNGANDPWTAQGQGFDTFVGFNGGYIQNYFNTRLEFNGVVKPTEGYITDVLTDEALAFIKENRDQPFFAYVSYNVPHEPFQVADDLFDKYYERLDISRKGGSENVRLIKTAAVYGMNENMDTNIGRLLDTLEELGLAENTIVIYTTDNGPAVARYNGIWRGGKGSLYEGGVRVPLIIRYPDALQAGNVVDSITMHVDMFPTLLEFAGVPLPEDRVIDGKSIVPLLKGTASDWPARSYFEIMNRIGADGDPIEPFPGSMVSERHKFLVDRGGQKQLYDLEADPEEQHNLAETNPELFATFAAAYEEWFHETTRENGAVVRMPVYQLGAGTELLVSEALFSGGAKFFGKGFDYDWAFGFENPHAAVHWPVEVSEGGNYEVQVLYTAKQLGTITVQVGEISIEAAIPEIYDPPYEPSHNRAPVVTLPEKPFRSLLIGTINIPSGSGEVRATTTEGAEIQTVRLKRRQP